MIPWWKATVVKKSPLARKVSRLLSGTGYLKTKFEELMLNQTSQFSNLVHVGKIWEQQATPFFAARLRRSPIKLWSHWNVLGFLRYPRKPSFLLETRETVNKAIRIGWGKNMVIFHSHFGKFQSTIVWFFLAVNQWCFLNLCLKLCSGDMLTNDRLTWVIFVEQNQAILSIKRPQEGKLGQVAHFDC